MKMNRVTEEARFFVFEEAEKDALQHAAHMGTESRIANMEQHSNWMEHVEVCNSAINHCQNGIRIIYA